MLEIRPATTDADLGEIARIVSAVLPDDPTSVEEMRRLGYRPLPDDIDYRGPLWPRRPEQLAPPPRYVTMTPEGIDR